MRYLLTLVLSLAAATCLGADYYAIPGSSDMDVTVTMADGTDGSFETGITSSDSPVLYYWKVGANDKSSDFYAGDHAAINDDHTDGEIFHVGQGEYRVSIPDGAIASSGHVIVWMEVSGMACVSKAHIIVQQAVLADAEGKTFPADGSIEEATFADVTEPTAVPPTSSINPMEMLKYIYFYGGRINKTIADVDSNGDGEMQYYDSGNTKRFERDVATTGDATTEDEVRAND